jgi:hypothetical protein
MNPMHDRFTKWEVFWSEWVESCRKDVECFFALVKCQWRLLRNKVEYHDAIIIQHCLHTACILHNMLLAYKEYDTFQWDAVDPEEEEGMHEENPAFAEAELLVSFFCRLHILISYLLNSRGDIFLFLSLYLFYLSLKEPVNGMAVVPRLGLLTQQHGGVIPYHASRFDELRRALVNHHTAHYLTGHLCWPRRFTADQVINF